LFGAASQAGFGRLPAIVVGNRGKVEVLEDIAGVQLPVRLF
jgi:hypothetical protein